MMLSNSGILVKYASLASFCLLFCIENLLGQQGPCKFGLRIHQIAVQHQWSSPIRCPQGSRAVVFSTGAEASI